MSEKNDKKKILSLSHLSTCFKTDLGVVTAVDDVSFDLFAGETLAIVGESGCGKTVTGKSIMRLLPEHQSFFQPESRIGFDGINLVTADRQTMRGVRGNRIGMIFQEPMTALNPVFTVGWQLDEALKYHTQLNKKQRVERAVEMLEMVEMPNPRRRLREYPHQLSGGMRQRVLIAIALCCEPEILIADEPTTALDVTIQAQILRLMEDLKRKTGTAIILITHDLGVVAQTSDRVLVMYAGRIVEEGQVRDIFHRPQHPYTQALLKSVPKAGRERGRRMETIEGIVPSLYDLPVGCRFHNRCPYRADRCVAEEPSLAATDGHRSVRCFFPLSQ